MPTRVETHRCGRIVRPGGDRGVAEHGVDVGGAGEDRGVRESGARDAAEKGRVHRSRGAVRGEKGWRDAHSQGGRGASDRGDGIRYGDVPKVDKLFGPGNQFVTAAKMALQNSDAMVSIDMPAGPSEVLVIADKDAPPAHVAADLLSQAEHGPDSQVVLVTFPDVDLKAITDQVAEQARNLPRADITAKALGHSYAVVVDDMAAACDFSNRYAPEHLIVNVENAESWLSQLDNAGSIFLGRWTPESVGDYASGTNHVLPTYGYSRMYSGVSLDSFVKYMTVQELTKEGLDALGPHVARMAAVEGLDAHRSAVTLRLGID